MKFITFCNSAGPKYFFIKSAMHGKVLDIEGGNKQRGAKVVMYDQKAASDADNQLWFEDRYGNIRSKLNERLILDGSGKLNCHAQLDSFPRSFPVDGKLPTCYIRGK